MANNVGLEFAAKTDTGLVRAQNEDAIAISPDYGFAVLADGMGGYNAGEVASGMAIAVVRQSLEEGLDGSQGKPAGQPSGPSKQIQHLIVNAFHRANSAILDAAATEPGYRGMGTTLLAAFFHHDKVVVAHVGDSRAYRFRLGELVQLTRDHSLLQEQLDAGLISPEWARFSQNKNLVTRAIGVGPEVEVEIHEHLSEPDDIYLLCSDGLSDMLLPEEMCDLLGNRQTSLERACHALVQRANDQGGHDNISVILIRVQSTHVGTNGLLARILGWIV